VAEDKSKLDYGERKEKRFCKRILKGIGAREIKEPKGNISLMIFINYCTVM